MGYIGLYMAILNLYEGYIRVIEGYLGLYREILIFFEILGKCIYGYENDYNTYRLPLQNRGKKRCFFRGSFWTHFGPLLDPFGTPVWSHVGAILGPFWSQDCFGGVQNQRSLIFKYQVCCFCCFTAILELVYYSLGAIWCIFGLLWQ